ncbi:penicillin-binding transpeptidase domain-containing protein [Clostridium uliginosum]|uniref:Penicillin-binding protein 2 n=1 Tax=Clostridium uliginosum TaxID=119641 RepID=A0A1I1IDQ7_9CLOT|nr:penicillin-binding transpeptidase domain-containing protein [Clostridium uliginosum]SFC31350.1 penicillin-binding protein 2 [Clostridium uliginosum]
MIVNKPTKKKKFSRYKVLSIIMFIIFGAITTKLIYLQILNYDNYKEKANANSTRFVSEKAPRGKIYDQNGNILATNIQTYALTYTKTTDADKQFYSTTSELLKILNENNEAFQDNLFLKIDDNNNIYFEYKTSDADSKKHEEIRFKRDRGLNDSIQKELFKGVEELSDKQIEKVDNELAKISAEDTFYYLVKSYNLISSVDPNPTKEQSKIYDKMDGKEITNILLNNGYSLKDIRNFIVIKDAIKMQSFKGYKAVTIASNIKKDTAIVVYQKLIDLPGIGVSLEPIRYYPNNELASSVLGYVSSIDSSKTENYQLRGYDVSSDLIGKTGIESSFEEQLKGVKGGTTVKVNSQGRVTEELFKLESYPGNDVHLTIDDNIQYASEQALADGIKNIQTNSSDNGYSYKNATRGALIAVEVKTGRILSLVSYPSFNPNLFTVPGKLTPEEYKKYFNPDLDAFGKELIQRMGLNKTVEDLFPMKDGYRTDKNYLYPSAVYNYATMSLIPPGSTFKPLTAVAGIESGAIKPDEIIVDRGKFDEHPETFGKGFAPSGIEYRNGGFTYGPVGLAKAIQDSINYYFYETAYKLYKLNGGDPSALDSIAKYAWQFGLGFDPNSKEKHTTGIEIEESFGQTYNFKSWKEISIAYDKYELVDYLEKGEYKGTGATFIPFDIRVSEDDNEEVKSAKQSIKDKVSDILSKVGTDEKQLSHDDFAKDVKKDVKNIMEHSDEYKSRVQKFEASGKKANLDNQASTVAESIAQFTINDKSGEIKTPGQLVYASIGQSMNNFTPLQLVSYVSTLANGGTRYKLHLVDKVTDNDGNVVQEFNSEVLNKIDIKDSTLKVIKEGMSAVNNEEGGTAKAAFAGFPIPTAGKTGTADFAEDQHERGRSPYATYISYAPVDDPKIAVVAVVFDGGHGGYIAPAVRAVYEAYFKDELLQERPNYASESASFKKYVIDNPYSKTKEQIQTESASNAKNETLTKIKD